MKRRHSVFSCLWLSLILTAQLAAQDKITVYDELGEPLIGVHIINGDEATVTDDSGAAEFFMSDTACLLYTSPSPRDS